MIVHLACICSQGDGYGAHGETGWHRDDSWRLKIGLCRELFVLLSCIMFHCSIPCISVTFSAYIHTAYVAYFPFILYARVCACVLLGTRMATDGGYICNYCQLIFWNFPWRCCVLLWRDHWCVERAWAVNIPLTMLTRLVLVVGRVSVLLYRSCSQFKIQASIVSYWSCSGGSRELLLLFQ